MKPFPSKKQNKDNKRYETVLMVSDRMAWFVVLLVTTFNGTTAPLLSYHHKCGPER